jgi:hypothetical protein
MQIPDYQDTSAIERRSGNGDVFLKVYNNTGSKISAKAVKSLVPIWITGHGTVYVPIVIGTNAAKTSIIGAADTDHADKTYAFYQTAGYVPAATTSGTIHANDFLEVIDSGTSFIDEGANGGTQPDATCVAVAIANNDTDNWSIYLFGNPVIVEGS